MTSRTEFYFEYCIYILFCLSYFSLCTVVSYYYTPTSCAIFCHFKLTLVLLPPIDPGLIDPVSQNLVRIFETQPCETSNCLLMSQGRTPNMASSTILFRTTSGRGRPFTNTPPSWFTPACPGKDILLINESQYI